MIGADFQSLITSHHQPDFLVLRVLKQTNISSTALLPFRRRRIKSEQLCTPVSTQMNHGEGIQKEPLVRSISKIMARDVQFEDDVVLFFAGFGINLFCELDHWLEMRISFLLGLFESVCAVKLMCDVL
jgi:hypothetical protein